MTGYNSKRQMAKAKLDEDDDTQVYADTLLIVYQRGFADGKAAQQQAEPVAVKHGVIFFMHGEKMAFKIGNQQFTLDYQPSEPGEFEFMANCLKQAFNQWQRPALPSVINMENFVGSGKPVVFNDLTTPPQREWVGLEPEEILDLFDRNNVYGSKWIEFARTVEAKLKEKNDH